MLPTRTTGLSPGSPPKTTSPILNFFWFTINLKGLNGSFEISVAHTSFQLI